MIHDILLSAWQLAQNPTFSGIVGASVVGGAMWALREVPRKIGEALLHIVSREVVIQNDNIGFEWLERWMAETKYMNSMWLRKMRLTVIPSETIENDDYEKVIAPGSGYHLLWHKRRPLLVHRWQDEKSPQSVWTNRKFESVQFRMFFGGRDRLLSIVEEAQERAKFIPGRIPLYLWAQGGWNKAPAIRPRALNTVYLAEDQRDAIIEDAKWFTHACDWYAHRGVPYRRGYLFKGPPGTGKTTLAIALASALRRPVYVIPISGITNDTEFSAATMSVPRNAILLLEDIDTVKATKDREQENNDEKKDKDAEPKAGVTLGGVLNGIDGVFASEGRILVMTTNYPEKLDAALVRPGRVDMNVDFGFADQAMMAAMFNTFYYDDPTLGFTAEHFDGINPVSPATVQTLLLRHRDKASVAMEALRTVSGMIDEEKAA